MQPKPAIPTPPVRPARPEHRARRIALVVCNGTFKHMPDVNLKSPADDASSMTSVLANPEVCGFEVHALLDKGLREVRLETARICGEAGAEDTLLIYYSGWGLADSDGTFHLSVADTHPDYLQATGLDADFFLANLRRSKCHRFVVIIDAPQSGAFFNNNRGIPNGLYAITACGAAERSVELWDAEGECHGALTAGFLRGLRGAAADFDGDGRVSMDELHEFAKQHLANYGSSELPLKWVWNVPEPIYLTLKQRLVFLSYAREDKEAAGKLKGALEREGLSTWLDREEVRSGNWEDRVTEGLNKSRALVLLFSARSLGKPTVRKELDFADTKKVPIIPVELDESSAKSLPDWFRLNYGKLQRYSLRSDEGYEKSVRDLADAIRRLRKAASGSE